MVSPFDFFLIPPSDMHLTSALTSLCSATYKKISKVDFSIPPTVSPEASDLIRKVSFLDSLESNEWNNKDPIHIDSFYHPGVLPSKLSY
jgi:hypothetical protein